jgi:hypothetical protein
MMTETAPASPAARKNIGARFKTGTSSAAHATSCGLGQTTALPSVTPVTSHAMENSGCLVAPWTTSTARDTPKSCTDYLNENKNSQKNNMKRTSTTTKATLQPYSQSELNEIAENVAAFRRALVKEYTYTDHDGKLHVKSGGMWSYDRNRLHHLTHNLYELGAHKPHPEASFTLKVIGSTIC